MSDLPRVGSRISSVAQAYMGLPGRKYVELAMNVAGSMGTRVVNIAVTAITVPLMLSTLGTTDYAIMAAVMSFSQFVSFSDLGLGTSVVNPVAAAHTPEATAAAKHAISQAWALQLFIGSVIVAAGVLVSILWLWLEAGSAGSLPAAAGVALVAVGFGLIFGLGQRVLFARGRNLEASLWLVSGRILAAVGCYIGFLFGFGVEGFTAVQLGAPTLVAFILFFYLFVVRAPDLAPNLREFSRSAAIRQLKTGLMFSLLSFSVFCEIGIDALFLKAVSTPDVVTSYDVVSKPFFYICSLSGIMLFPIWPFVAKEMALTGKPPLKFLKWSFGLVVGSALILSTLIWVYIEEIVYFWVGRAVTVDRALALVLAANAVMVSVGILQSMVLNAANRIKEQVRIQVVFLSALIPMKLFLSYSYGALGLASALCFCYGVRLVFVHLVCIRPYWVDVKIG
ncbi:lipopolysaccharide biosynthesis protein [Jiella avicenniae]|uniref:Membrane protein involved in the export of O-antigen and teichoic acid n=1 Tax=Jiella avicenniae TaxID=2907202 RepID=A0A9X1T730_9HYPH|nr:hypothetical protein [Jiella avicenniae]MCE7030852.1 hypothetical protein [Jiella avicenniae]